MSSEGESPTDAVAPERTDPALCCPFALRGPSRRERLLDVKVLRFPLLLLVGTLAGAQSPPAATAPALASYVAESVNGGKLPSVDRVSDKDGTQYLVEFDELVIALRPGNQFRAALRYRQTLALRGSAIGRDPIQRMTVYGRYEVHGNTLRFIPDPQRGGKGIDILDGTFAARRIDVPFFYRNGQVSRRAQVVLKRDDSRF